MAIQTDAVVPGAIGEGGVAGVQAEAAGERPAFTEGYGEAMAKLPAFLERGEKGEYKLPEGYKVVELGPGESLLIGVGLTPGSEVVCYAGNVGVRLTRGKTGKIHFRA